MDEFPKVLVVNVTQADIDSGVRNNCIECPIAKSASRRLNRTSDSPYIVQARPSILLVSGLGFKDWSAKASYQMSEAGRDFMDAFDNGSGVGPITLRLRRSERLAVK